jgi:rhodanese-related sulfurtransferase
MAKGFKDMLTETNAVIETISVQEALLLQGKDDHVFLDVRESQEQDMGIIAGAVRAPRGFLEFHADNASPMHNQAIDRKKMLVLYCASGGRSTLASKTLLDMGFPYVCHIAGGYAAWLQAGGETGR